LAAFSSKHWTRPTAPRGIHVGGIRQGTASEKESYLLGCVLGTGSTEPVRPGHLRSGDAGGGHRGHRFGASFMRRTVGFGSCRFGASPGLYILRRVWSWSGTNPGT
jgi:hypothetical protein